MTNQQVNNRSFWPLWQLFIGHYDWFT